MLIIVNIVLTFLLWRSTRSKNFGVIFLHWCFLLLGFYLQRTLVGYPSHIRTLIIVMPNFFAHYTLLWVFSSIAKFQLPLKKCLLVPLLIIPSTLILYIVQVKQEYISLPLVIGHSSLYFYCAYQSFRWHKNQMTFSLKAIGVLLAIYGFHLYTYAFFSTNLERFALGFAVAIAILMAIAILFPAAIIEQMIRENEYLRAEVEFKARLTQSAKMAALGEMAGGVAHEINNPLTILSLTLDKAQTTLEKKDYETLALSLEKSHVTVERMSKIVKGLLVFSRENSNEEFNQVIVQKLIEETLSLCSEKMKNHDIELFVSVPVNTVSFIGNELQISQVLLNLLNNSHDAIIDMNEKWIKLEVQDLGSLIEFSVTDSGQGIHTEKLEKIFQPFYTTKEVGKGTGLGLSISRGIIEGHRGKLMVDTISKNTKFFFILPKFAEPFK